MPFREGLQQNAIPVYSWTIPAGGTGPSPIINCRGKSSAVIGVSTGVGITTLIHGYSQDGVNFTNLPAVTLQFPRQIGTNAFISTIAAPMTALGWIGLDGVEYYQLTATSQGAPGGTNETVILSLGDGSYPLGQLAAQLYVGSTQIQGITTAYTDELSVSGATVAVPVWVPQIALNRNTIRYDRLSAVSALNLVASGARTTPFATADITNYNWPGVKVTLNITVLGTTGLTVHIQGKDSANSNNYYDLLTASAPANATAAPFVYDVYPGALATAIGGGITQAVNGILPRVWRVNVTGDGSSFTYSLSADMPRFA